MALQLPKDVPGASLLNLWARDMDVRINRVLTHATNAKQTAIKAHEIATAGQPAQSGAVGQIASGNFGYSSTTTSITIYWDGTNSSTQFVVHLPDGSSLTVPKGSLTCTGLTANVSYKFYPYYNLAANTVIFAIGGVGTPTIAFTAANTAAAAIQILNGNIALSSSVAAATPSSGTGGGSGGGGGGCLAPWVEVETPEGKRCVSELHPGDWISTPLGWTQILSLKENVAHQLYTVCVEGGRELPCTETHPLALRDGRWATPVALGDLSGWEVLTVDGPAKVVEVKVEEKEFLSFHPRCSPHHEFWANGILTHNFMYQK